MTIASEITRIKTNISNAYDALEEKGATIPSDKNSANLVSTIDTITVGSQDYLGRVITEDGIFQYPTESFSFSLPDNVTSIGEYALSYGFYNCTNLTSADLSNITTISDYGLDGVFTNCANLAYIDLSNVTSIGFLGLDHAFQNCTSLTSIDLNNLTVILSNGLSYAFWGCTNLASVGFNNVTQVGNSGLEYAFYGCTSLTTLSFPSLKSQFFLNKSDQFYSMLRGVTGCTVHFPSNLESVIGAWSDVTNGFSGTNTTVLFDLPATT